MRKKTDFLPVRFKCKSQSIIGFTTTKTFGNAKLSSIRSKLAGFSGIDLKMITTCSQVHGSRVITVHSGNSGIEHPAADGLITAEMGVVLAVFTADCLPVFMYDPEKKAAGLVHAGWKGTGKRIVEKAVKILEKKYGSSPRDIEVFLGPCICRECHGYDLLGGNLSQLAGLGVRNVSASGACTHENGNMFSYKRDGGTAARMISVLMMR